mmetsp:Transcript_5414/g.20447  ORF Transcript_5414/g.20447 Transcript_5414/m.20447 type:complete len:302 (+) Transcript_5414:671-1576(+)
MLRYIALGGSNHIGRGSLRRRFRCRGLGHRQRGVVPDQARGDASDLKGLHLLVLHPGSIVRGLMHQVTVRDQGCGTAGRGGVPVVGGGGSRKIHGQHATVQPGGAQHQQRVLGLSQGHDLEAEVFCREEAPRALVYRSRRRALDSARIQGPSFLAAKRPSRGLRAAQIPRGVAGLQSLNAARIRSTRGRRWLGSLLDTSSSPRRRCHSLGVHRPWPAGGGPSTSGIGILPVRQAADDVLAAERGAALPCDGQHQGRRTGEQRDRRTAALQARQPIAQLGIQLHQRAPECALQIRRRTAGRA